MKTKAPTKHEASLTAAKRALSDARNVVALTGAGISVESGIPAFRIDVYGLWKTFPMQKASIGYFKKNPADFWKTIGPMAEKFLGAHPNAAHNALFRLENAGRLKALITQNIDGLHQEAGSKNVIEFHGNGREFVCLKCHAVFALGGKVRMDKALHDLKAGVMPCCPGCGAALKPNATLFGEAIPEAALEAAYVAVAAPVDVVLIVGTSGLIYPANQFPGIAKHDCGAVIIEVNTAPSAYGSEGVTDIYVQGPAGEVLPQILPV
ncbi:MAG: Sir2 family NAD-dependent protein deacetylase [Candidatus Paceibacterota bacterium]|jgi:NAD-dependent deacetylase